MKNLTFYSLDLHYFHVNDCCISGIEMRGNIVCTLSLTSKYEKRLVKVVREPCQKITLLLLKSKSVRVIVPESCFC